MDRFDEMRTKKVSQVVTKKITVTPQKVVAITGQTQQFTANEDATWSIDGNFSPNTTISSTGLLSVAQDEKSKFITIIATSGNSAGYAQASIKVQYIITFDPAGGTFKDGSTEPITQAYFAGEVITNIPVAEKVDYRLTNWVDENGITLNENTKVSGDMTYTAEWVSTKVEFVEFIESTGTQYIDTGIAVKPDFYIEVDTVIEDTSSLMVLMGTSDSYGSTICRFWVCSFQPSTLKTNCALMNNAISTKNLYVNTKYHIYIKFFNGEQKLYVNDELYSSATNTATASAQQLWESQGTLLIGKPVYEATYYFIGKIYSFKMYDKDKVLIRDFHPCRDSNGVACMYDTVTKTYFYNQGTGNFVTP